MFLRLGVQSGLELGLYIDAMVEMPDGLQAPLLERLPAVGLSSIAVNQSLLPRRALRLVLRQDRTPGIRNANSRFYV